MRWTMGALLALVLAIAFGIWIVGQTVALRFALDQATQLSGGRFSALGVRGTLYGAARIASLTWRDGELDVVARDLTVRFSLRALFSREARISRLHAASIDVQLPPAKPGPIPLPASLVLPVPIEVASLKLDRLTVKGPGEPVVIEEIALAARYRDGRYRISGLRAVHRDASVREGTIEMADAPPYALRGDIAASSAVLARAFASRADAPAELRADIAVALQARGDLQALDLTAETNAAGASLRATATVNPLAERPLPGIEVQIGGVDLRRIVPAAPATALAGKLRVRNEGGWRGDFDISNARPGPIDQDAIPVDGARGAFALQEGTLRLTELAIATLGGGRINGSVSVGLSGTQRIGTRELPRGNAQLRLRGLDLQALATQARSTRLDGTIALEDGTFTVDLAQGEIPELEGPLALRAQLRLVEREVLVEQVRLAARAGTVRASGRVWLDDGPRLAFSGEAEKFDPGRWLERRGLAEGRVADTLLNGDFGFDLRLGPRLAGNATVTVRASRWAGQALAGSVRARIDAAPAPQPAAAGLRIARVSEVEVDLSLGGNRLQASGALGQSDDRMTFRIGAPRPAALDARAAGRLTIDGELRGSLTGPAIRASIDGSALAWDGVGSIGALTAQIELPDLGAAARALGEGTGSAPLGVQLRAERLRFGETAIERIVLEADGSAMAHRFRLEAEGLGQKLSAAGTGSYLPGPEPGRAGRWQAEVREAALAGRVAASLRAPARVSVAPSGVVVEQLSVALAQGSATIASLRYEGGRLQSTGELQALPLARLLEWSDTPVPTPGAGGAGREIEGLRLDAKWELAGTSLDDLSGQASARLRAVAVTGVPMLPLGDDGNRVDVRLRAGALEGEIELALPSLAFSRRYTGSDWAADGEVRFSGKLAGTLRKPRFAGELTGRGLQLVQRSMGWRLANGSLRARFDGETLQIESLRMESGNGSIELRGEAKILAAAAATAPAPGTAAGAPAKRGRVQGRFDLLARKLPIPIGPGQRLIISGDTAVVGDEQSLRWTGKLRADEGLIELRSAGAPELPDDVVFIDRRSGAAAPPSDAPVARRESPLRLAADLEIDLGDRIKVRGGGIDARLAGTIRLTGTLPAQPRAVGVVRVLDGTFNAYGQKLEISRGVIRFQGELDNPVLDIVAERRYLAITPGVAVTGTALSPRVKLVSTPDVPDADKLSWLVLGTGLDEAGGSAQVFALRQAASSLLGSDDGTLAGGIGQALGVDVLAIGSARTGGPTQAIADRGVPGEKISAGSAGSIAQQNVVTIGKRLSSRLFVSYEQGLQGVWNLLRIQYEISNRLSVRAQTGSESAVDLLWYFWFD